MPKFKVLCRVDAFVHYEAEVEAKNAAAAARLANNGNVSHDWTRVGETEFDARLYVALDADGVEIDSTECGDF